MTRPPPAANGCSATEPPSVPMEAVPPRLMLVSPAFDRDAAAAQVEAALAVARDADIAALLLRGGSLDDAARSEEHTSELPSLMRISYAVFCLKKTQRHT